MKCVSIVAKGNLVGGRQEFYNNGFLVIPYDGNMGELSECSVPMDTVHSLADALDDQRFEGEDYVIYTNGVPTGAYRAERLMTDLDLPHSALECRDAFLLMSDTVLDVFALIVHSTKRGMIASMLRKSGGDLSKSGVLLNEWVESGQLDAKVLKIPVFGKESRSRDDESFESRYPGRKLNMAVVLPSYKRFEDCVRQVHCMLAQTHQSDLYVSVKGISKHDVETVIKPMFRGAIDSGRLYIDYCRNSNQLSNIVDCIRDYDYGKYDLLAKVDDDDFYGPCYLESIIDVHRQIPEGYSSFYRGTCLYLKKHEGTPCFKRGFMSIFGRSLVITPEVFETILKIEESPTEIGRYCDEVRTRYGNSMSFCFTEDNLMRMLMCERGAFNRADFIDNEDLSRGIIAHGSNDSVLRGNLVSKDFREKQNNLSCRSDEDFVHLIHPFWTDTVRVFDGRSGRISYGSSSDADVLLFDERKLVLKWDKYGAEEFLANENGAYVFNPSQVNIH